MSGSDERRAAAIKHYESQLKWYEDHASSDQLLYKAFQVSTLLFSALTPVLLAFKGLPAGVAAASSGIAAVAAGTVSIFNWRANWIRFARTAERLKSERVLFETRSSPLYNVSLETEIALENFVERVEAIIAQETEQWGEQISKTVPLQSADRG